MRRNFALLMALLGTAGALGIDYGTLTIDGGGDVSTGNGFQPSSTIGQHDAGYSSGGGFELSGGYWVSQTTPQGCPADIDNSGTIDLSDLSIVLSQFGQMGVGLQGDVNNDGAVDLSDLSEILAAFGASC